MLHRTQAKQVIAIYEQFISLYPTLKDFSQADQVNMKIVLSSLGLQWRIDGMINALMHLWITYGEVPLDREKLMAVAGIGQYIAGATLCFTKNEPVTLIDTNTVRVVGRIFGLDLSGEARRRKDVVNAVSVIPDPEEPRDFYYALIDFANKVCKPRMPACYECPLFDLPCKYGNDFIANAKPREK